MDPAALFAEPLFDLGDVDPRFAGIHAPESAREARIAGVTEQFLENAAEYHRRYFDTSYWALVLGQAFERIGEAPAPRTIIDIGSGSGNSVIALADRFREARIVATDASPQLLSILRDFLQTRPDRERFALVCVDATRARYRGGMADLAVGAALLHHVFEPEQVLASCLQALASERWAMFFEPFEAGTLLFTLTYERVLGEASSDERLMPGMRMLRKIVDDVRVRRRPRSDPIYRELDDKWMFTRSFFERVARGQGWAQVLSYALHASPGQVRKQAAVHLRLGAGLGPEALPDWAWAVIDEVDAGISDDLREELAVEAAVLLKKA